MRTIRLELTARNLLLAGCLLLPGIARAQPWGAPGMALSAPLEL